MSSYIPFQNDPRHSVRHADADFKYTKVAYCENIQTLLEPTILIEHCRLNSELVEFNFTFEIPPDLRPKLKKTENLPRYEIQLRVFEHNLDTTQSDSFPKKFDISINNTGVVLPEYIKEMKRGNETESERRKSRPVNITKNCLLHKNKSFHVNVQWRNDNDDVDYVVAIFFVEHVDAKTLYERLLHKPRAYSQSKLLLIKQFIGEGDELDVDSLKFSLVCPVSSTHIETPARFKRCTHFQCFDLLNFLICYEQKSRWKCPICNEDIHDKEEFVIDNYFAEKLSTFDVSVKRVDLSFDILWRAADEKPATNPTTTLIKQIKEEPRSSRSSVDPLIFDKTIDIESSEEEELLRDPPTTETKSEDPPKIQDNRIGSTTNPKIHQTDLRSHLSPIPKSDAKQEVEYLEADQQRPRTRFSTRCVQQLATKTANSSIRNSLRNALKQSKPQEPITKIPLVIDLEEEELKSSIKHNIQKAQIPLRQASVPLRTSTPTLASIPPISSHSNRKRLRSGSSTVDEQRPKVARITDSDKTNVHTSTEPSSSNAPKVQQATGQSAFKFDQWQPRHKPKKEVQEEKIFDIDYKTFKNPTPEAGNLERKAKGLPEYHDWSQVQNQLATYLEKNDYKVVDGPLLNQLLSNVNSIIYGKKAEISMESLKLRLRRLASSSGYWAEAKMRCEIDFAVTREGDKLIDMKKLRKKVQDKYNELLAGKVFKTKRTITEEEVKERVNISKREKDIQNSDKRFEEAFVKYSKNIMMLDTSAVYLGMPLHISLDELEFDLYNELDQIAGFEISETKFRQILSSELFKDVSKKFPTQMKKDLFEQKLLIELPSKK